MKNINDRLSVKKYIDFMQSAVDFRFNVFDLMSSLVYARLVPVSYTHLDVYKRQQ